MRLLLMAILMVTINVTPEAQRLIESWQEGPRRAEEGLRRGLQRMLADMEGHLERNYLRGKPGSGSGGNTPVGLRSSGLLIGTTSAVDQHLSGYVGTGAPAERYAHVILGEGTWTIKPRNAEHLWVPIADNLGATLQPKLSPRAAIDLGARTFKSRKGNWVVFLPDEQGGAYTRGKKKGLQRGKLLFVLKDEVTIKGTGALVKAVEERLPRGAEILGEELRRAFLPTSGGASGGGA